MIDDRLIENRFRFGPGAPASSSWRWFVIVFLHHSSAERLVTIPSGNDRVLAERPVHGRARHVGAARSHRGAYPVQKHRVRR